MAFHQNIDRRSFLDANGAPLYRRANNAPNLFSDTNSCINYSPYSWYNFNQVTSATITNDPSIVMNFGVRYLVSNVIGLEGSFDAELDNPWDIAVIDDIIWVSSFNTGYLLGYDMLGTPLFIANIFGSDENIFRPTGICYNQSSTDFVIRRSDIIEASVILIATFDGTINGYNPIVNVSDTILLLDRSDDNCVYTGLHAMSLIDRNNNRQSLLFVADFFNRKIDVFDGNLEILDGFFFIDENSNDPIPRTYAPYNIVAIEDYLYVSYAESNPSAPEHVIGGPNSGYISRYNFNGEFVDRFYSRGVLNAPYDMCLVPSSYGYPSGSIMVSNYGDGSIAILDHDGNYVGSISGPDQNTMNFGGIRGITVNPNHQKSLYYVSSTNYSSDSFVGSIFHKLLR